MKAVLDEGSVCKRASCQPALESYPMSEWSKLMIKVHKLYRFVKKSHDGSSRFTAGVNIVEWDVSGRLLVPKDPH